MVVLPVHFFLFRNPTPQATKLIPNKWEPYTLKNEEYYQIDNAVLETRKHVLKERAEFWRSINDPLKEDKKGTKEEL